LLLLQLFFCFTPFFFFPFCIIVFFFGPFFIIILFIIVAFFLFPFSFPFSLFFSFSSSFFLVLLLRFFGSSGGLFTEFTVAGITLFVCTRPWREPCVFQMLLPW